MISLLVKVDAVRGQMRPRVTKRGTVYKATKDREYEKIIANAFREAYPDFEPIRGAVRLYVRAYRPLPKSRPKKVLIEPDTCKPDLSNIVKSVEDALNGLAWVDDSQIIECSAQKLFRTRNNEPYIFVEFEEVK